MIRLKLDKACSNTVIVTIFLLALSGLVSYESYNFFPAKKIFEVLLVLLFVFSFHRFRKDIAPFLFFSIAYTFCSAIYCIAVGRFHLADFFLVYKPFIYISLLSFFSGKTFFSVESFVFLFRGMLLFFLAKYILWQFISSNNRPGIFTENNFELMFLLLLYIIYLQVSANKNFFVTFLVVSIFLLSGSRSGVLALFFVLFFSRYSRNLSGVLIKITSAFFGILGVLFVFSGRQARFDIEAFDRFRFVLVFVEEVSSWNFWQFLFGVKPMTPLSQESCELLSYYESLFSTSDVGSCYSVVLHTFLLRIVFDHGLVGLTFVLGFIFYILTKSGCSYRSSFLISGVVLAFGLSISSFYSVFFTLAFAIVVLTDTSKKHQSFNPVRCNA